MHVKDVHLHLVPVKSANLDFIYLQVDVINAMYKNVHSAPKMTAKIVLTVMNFHHTLNLVVNVLELVVQVVHLILLHARDAFKDID